ISALGGPNLSGLIDLNGEVFFIGSEFDGSVDIGGDFMIASFENLHTGFRFSDGVLTLDTLYGTILENCAIDGFGRINFSTTPEQYQLYVDLKNFNLSNLIEGAFPSDLSGELILKGESFHNADLKLQADVDLKESLFDEYPLQKALGRITITTDSIKFGDEFEIGYFENDFYVGGKVDYKNEMNLEVVADLANLDRYRGKLFINEPSGRGHAEARLSGKTSDPDLSGWFASDSVWLYDVYCDSLFTTFNIDRFLTGRDGEVTANMFNGSAYEIPFDTMYIHLNLDSNMVHFDSVTLNNTSARITAKGSFDSESQPQELSIDTLAMDFFGQPSYNRGPIEIAIDSIGFEIRRANIGNRETALSATGRFNYNQTLNINLELTEVRAAPWISLFEQD
ncbi:MAG TPA: hypothetical protein VLA12_15160, partial [Planctomycetaceae bacterium]|nr:hypothetical protein [Planctomycetaceae bacterium]